MSYPTDYKHFVTTVPPDKTFAVLESHDSCIEGWHCRDRRHYVPEVIEAPTLSGRALKIGDRVVVVRPDWYEGSSKPKTKICVVEEIRWNSHLGEAWVSMQGEGGVVFHIHEHRGLTGDTEFVSAPNILDFAEEGE